jgi:hypothetical protein
VKTVIVRDNDTHVYTEHKANLASGGKVTTIELGNFLGLGRAGRNTKLYFG